MTRLKANLPVHVDDNIDAEDLYTPREQAVRVYNKVSGNELLAPPPAGLPQSVRDIYEQAANVFVADHPFIKGADFASLVFRDYVLATVCFDAAAVVMLRERPVAQGDDVGPYFTHFVSQNRGDSEVGVPESLVEALMSSWTQEAELKRSTTSEVRLSLVDGASSLQCRSAGIHGDEIDIEFLIADRSGAFHLRRGVKKCWVSTDGGLILGARNEHLSLGPGVVLVAGSWRSSLNQSASRRTTLTLASS